MRKSAIRAAPQLRTPQRSSTSSYTLVDFDDFAILHRLEISPAGLAPTFLIGICRSPPDDRYTFWIHVIIRLSATWKDTVELVGVAAIVTALVFVVWNFGSLEK